MPENKVEIVVVVGGTRVSMDPNQNAPLQSIFQKALHDVGVAGAQKLEDWEFKTEGGALLDPTKKFAELGIVAGFTLFLSQKVGAAG
jgi:hypothetical protein